MEFEFYSKTISISTCMHCLTCDAQANQALSFYIFKMLQEAYVSLKQYFLVFSIFHHLLYTRQHHYYSCAERGRVMCNFRKKKKGLNLYDSSLKWKTSISSQQLPFFLFFFFFFFLFFRSHVSAYRSMVLPSNWTS